MSEPRHERRRRWRESWADQTVDPEPGTRAERRKAWLERANAVHQPSSAGVIAAQRKRPPEPEG